MSTLLLLGSKPNPVIPSKGSYDAVACANASGYSAKNYDLKSPVFTVIAASSLMSSNESAKKARKNLRGLSTNQVFIYPSKQEFNFLRLLRKLYRANLKSSYLEIKRHKLFTYLILKTLGYKFKHYSYMSRQKYQSLFDIAPLKLNEYNPSTGIVALMIGVKQFKFDTIIISGFSFETNHIYDEKVDVIPVYNRHFEFDSLTIKSLYSKGVKIITTEKTVSEICDIPLI